MKTYYLQECANCLTCIFSFSSHYIPISPVFRSENGFEKVTSERWMSNVCSLVEFRLELRFCWFCVLLYALCCIVLRLSGVTARWFVFPMRRRDYVMLIVWKWERKHPTHPFHPWGVPVRRRLGWEESFISLWETMCSKEIDWKNEEGWRHEEGIWH